MIPEPFYTVGDSTRSLEDFVAMLRGHGISCVTDVRTVPRSRHVPQFNAETLPGRLAEGEIGYLHLKDLGGFRKPSPDSKNKGWRNESFRGYADYMQSEEFEAALEQLIEVGRNHRTAIMCAEAVPFRCHRSLIADALTLRGFMVRHIISATRADQHRLTPFASVNGNQITYPAEES